MALRTLEIEIKGINGQEDAEEQERRKWATIGRAPGQFKVQDVVQVQGGEFLKIRTGVTYKSGEMDIGKASELYNNDQIMMIYPIDSVMEL